MSENSVKGNTNSLTRKLLTIIATALILMIPIAFISEIISDRVSYKEEAVQKVMTSWAGEQTISVPSLYYIDKTKNSEENTKYFNLNNYNVETNIKTEIRKKGIFKIPVYVADVTLKGNFINNIGDISKKNIVLESDISDVRGYIEEPILKIANIQHIKLNSTTNGIKTSSKNIPFEITYKIKGVNKININLGDTNNTISMKSDWKDPSFEGDYLPIKREITNKGFSANWSIPSIAIGKSDTSPASISVSLLVPVDSYKMTDRSLKYSFLLLCLSFLCYFIFEITSKEENKAKKIHPIQYCLLGAAILIFYLLLVSISEFLPFFASYMVATLMILSMIFLYTNFVITKNKNIKFSSTVTILMGILYLFFYVLLQLQDFALLMGSLALFVIISAVMYLTRNVDWYSNSNKQ